MNTDHAEQLRRQRAFALALEQLMEEHNVSIYNNYFAFDDMDLLKLSEVMELTK